VNVWIICLETLWFGFQPLAWFVHCVFKLKNKSAHLKVIERFLGTQ